jgi:hypothetical protein
MALKHAQLSFDPLSLPREWSIPMGRAVAGLVLSICLAILILAGWVNAGAALIRMVLDQDGTRGEVFRSVAAVILAPQMVAMLAEFAAACFAGLSGHPSEVRLTEDDFWHPQLAAPVRLADIKKLVVRRGLRVFDFSVTLHTGRPLRLRFLSPYNVKTFLSRRYRSYRFAFLPMPWSNRGALTQALIEAIEARGGEIVRR